MHFMPLSLLYFSIFSLVFCSRRALLFTIFRLVICFILFLEAEGFFVYGFSVVDTKYLVGKSEVKFRACEANLCREGFIQAMVGRLAMHLWRNRRNPGI